MSMRRVVLLLLAVLLPGLACGEPCENGLYIGTSWLTATKSNAEFALLVKRLQDAHVANVFVNASGVSSESSIAKSFIKNLKASLPDAKVIGMVVRSPWCTASVKISKCFNPDGESALHDLNADIKAVWKLGFDGLQMDFEAVPDGDRGFLRILERAKAAKPPKKILSVAGYFLELEDKEKQELVPKIADAAKDEQNLLIWKRPYYQALMARVDQVMVMNYDTALRSPRDYARFTEWQTAQLRAMALQAKVDLQIGLPSDMKGREGLYDRAAENLATGIAGVQAAIGKAGCAKGVSGVTIFNDRSMSPDLWRTFNSAFAGAAPAGATRPNPANH